MPENLRVYFPEHAMKTLARYYAEEEYIGLDVDDLVGRVQTELYRKRFHSFQDIKLAFEIQDSDKKGNMSPDRVYFVLRSTSLPINRDLLKSFIYKFPKAENKINYKDLVKSLDWIHHPAEYDSGEPHAIQINWERIETVKNMDKIKYNVFLMDVVPS
ncbi:hypothetical protein JTE90_016979 [Oedothorax gibbosus]|uniref:EF-hand domain-containing protein n=1 Tax=Oedothorax gibbosus TaxID=931172 RepID=A0AAV6TNX7_9ARAC|nr:hypothetical protein JTE90_016979 [Oedothorax gibbosus]